MVLTNEQIREILDVIRNRHYSFVYKNITRDIDPKQIQELRDKGYIQGSDNINSYFKDAYEITRLKELLETTKGKKMSFEQFKRFLFSNPIPMTDTEVASINHVQQSAGQYVTKQGDLLRHKAEEVIRNKNMDFKNDILTQTIRTPLQAGIEARQTVSEIVSEMREGSDDTFRDWHRVAQTEIQNARNHAAVDSIVSVNRNKSDDEILVFKRPNGDACRFCKSVYLESDGITPKVFKLSEMKKHVTNYGRKGGAKKYMPTLETLHPWCACELGTLPPGFGFDKKGHPTFKGKDYNHKAKKPEPAEKQLHLYDNNGNLKKSVIIEKIKKSPYSEILKKSLESTGRDEFNLNEVLQHLKEIKRCGHNILEKGRKRAPIGTISGNMKKVAEGKWEYIKKPGAKRGRPRKGTPRGDAEDTTKKMSTLMNDNKEDNQIDTGDYAYARESKISNKGEDLIASARHKRNQWKSLEEAEKEGIAENIITRKHLLKNEPPDFFKYIDEKPLLALTAFEALNKYITSPDTKKIQDDTKYVKYKRGVNTFIMPDRDSYDFTEEELIEKFDGKEYKKRIRKQYYDIYIKIKERSEKFIKEAKEDDPRILMQHLRDEIRNNQGELRKENYYSKIANQLVRYHNIVLNYSEYGRPKQTEIRGTLKQFLDEMQPRHEKKTLTKEQFKDAIKRYMEGESITTIFEKEKKDKQRFNPSEAYVNIAERNGPNTNLKTEKQQEKYLMQDAKIRGLQWGNSVTDDERKHHLQKASEAMKDLVDILDLPSEMVSFNGRLGFAIGARGRARALAHYEPDKQIINLTRKGGVGSLAHEWGHFFDATLLAATKDKKVSLNFASTYQAYNASEDQKEIWESISKLRSEMKEWIWNKLSKSEKFRRLSPLSQKYWASTHEVFARSFERYVQNELHSKDRENTYLVGIRKEGHPFWPDKEDIKKMKPHFDKLFSVFKNSKYLKKSIELSK